jgi:hypothetical protein
MAATRTQRVREMIEAEAAGIISPDQSVTVHQFADGWAVVCMQVASDVRRECWLMRNCVASYIGDPIDPAKSPDGRVIYAPSERPACDRLQPNSEHRHPGMRLMSLRDADNLPHLTFWADVREGGRTDDIGSYRNGKVKDTYVDRLDQWLTLQGMELARRGLKVAGPAAEEHARAMRRIADEELERIERAVRETPPMPPELWRRYEISWAHQDDPDWVEECMEVGRLLDEHYGRTPHPNEPTVDELRSQLVAEQIERAARELLPQWQRDMVT